MNDLNLPALYGAWQEIVTVTQAKEPSTSLTDVVGPVCETGDFLGKGRSINAQEGDLLAILSAGAYGFTMSSNYNSRGRSAEVLIKDGKAICIRRRETFEDIVSCETLMNE